MAEKGGTRPEESRAEWATTGDKTEYPGGKKTSGWIFEDTVPYDGDNWQRNFYYQMFVYLFGSIVRTFDRIHEAIGAAISLAFGDVFWCKRVQIYPPGTMPDKEPWTPRRAYTVTDGLQVYTADYTGSTVVTAHSPDNLSDGGELWNSSPQPHDVSALDAPGAYVYVGFDSPGGQEKIVRLDPETGAQVSGPAAYAFATPVRSIASNGTRVAMAGYANQVTLMTEILNTITHWDHGAPVNAVAMDRDYVYYCGEYGVGGSSSGADVVALNANTGAYIWSVTISIGAPDEPMWLCADGDYLYVVGGDSLLAAPRQISCLNRLTGQVVWQKTHAVGYGDPDFCVVDDRYLWAMARDNQPPAVYDKTNGEMIWLVSSSALTECISMAPNGMGVFIDGYDDPNYVLAWMESGENSKAFVRVDSDEANRQPFYNLAVPVKHVK